MILLRRRLSPSLPLQRSLSSITPPQTPPSNPNPKPLSSFFTPPKPLSSSLAQPKPLSSLFTQPKPNNKPSPSTQSTPTSTPTRNKTKKKESVLRYGPMEEKEFPKELSAEAASLLRRLLEDGYLKDANFLKGKDRLEDGRDMPTDCYARCFYRLAAEKFGDDHQDIAKWLSGKDLKTIALFGCPSIERKSVFAAKRLRSFFHIHEDNACRACKLSSLCHFKNQKVGAVEKVILGDIMRLIMVYTMNSVPKDLPIPDDLKRSVDKLLKEVVRLCDCTPSAVPAPISTD